MTNPTMLSKIFSILDGKALVSNTRSIGKAILIPKTFGYSLKMLKALKNCKKSSIVLIRINPILLVSLINPAVLLGPAEGGRNVMTA